MVARSNQNVAMHARQAREIFWNRTIILWVYPLWLSVPNIVPRRAVKIETSLKSLRRSKYWHIRAEMRCNSSIDERDVSNLGQGAETLCMSKNSHEYFVAGLDKYQCVPFVCNISVNKFICNTLMSTIVTIERMVSVHGMAGVGGGRCFNLGLVARKSYRDSFYLIPRKSDLKKTSRSVKHLTGCTDVSSVGWSLLCTCLWWIFHQSR